MRTSWLLMLALAACTDKTTDSDSDVDTSPDSDTSPDTEADTEPDTEADTEPVAQCDEAILYTAPFTVQGDDLFADYSALGDFTEGAGCGTGTGSEAAPAALVEFDAVAGQIVRVRETGPMDAVVFALDGCSASDACVASHDDPDEFFEFEVAATGRVVLALTAYDDFEQGQAYAFDVDVVDPEVCANGVDDDEDGAIDCNDSDCDDSCAGVCDAAQVSLPFTSTVSVDSASANTLRFLGCASPQDRVAYDLLEFDLAAGESAQLVTQDDVTGVLIGSCATGDQCEGFIESEPYVSESGETVLVAVGTVSQGSYTLQRLPAEVCDNGIDDSGEGLVDCDDTVRCATDDACLFECPSIETLPFTAAGSDWNADYDDALLFEETNGCQQGQSTSGVTGGDLVVPVSLAAGDRIAVTESGLIDSVVNIVQGTCSTAGLGNTCVAANDDGNNEQLVFEAPATDTYYIVVNSYENDPDPSAYDLSIERLVEDCFSNDDQDLDGDAGCDDSDCAGVGECAIQCDLPSFLPVRESGDNFAADFDDLYDFEEINGCEGGSSSDGGGADALYTVFPNPGDTIRIRETGTMDAIVNITAGVDACTPLRSDNVCEYSEDDGEDDAGVRLFEVTEDVAHHVTVSSWGQSDAGSYDIEVDVIPDGECGTVLGYGVHSFEGDSWRDIWPDEVTRLGDGGCVASETGGGDAMFRALLSDDDRIIVQDLTNGGVDLIVNISTDSCGDGSPVGITCVYGEDDPLGAGLPEIYTYFYERPPLTVDIPVMHTIQVSAFSSLTSDEPFRFNVTIIEAP